MRASSIVLIIASVYIATSNGNVEDGEGNTKQLNYKVINEDEYDMGYGMKLFVSPDPIESSQSHYQRIELYHSPSYFGKVLLLDGLIQLTEKDASHYNEMMAHVPMMEHAAPKRVSVIGGGDGYVVREVLKHETVERVDHVELDEAVVELSKRHFSWGDAWDDSRVELHVADGAAFAERAADASYDVVIQDSSDPFEVEEDGSERPLPSQVLYRPEHFANVYRILSPDGVFLFQAETYNVPSSLATIRSWRQFAIEAGFRSVRYGTIAIPSYPTGQIGFFVCTKNKPKTLTETDLVKVRERFSIFPKPTSYYHPRLQQSCFDLPLWVEHAIYGKEKNNCLNNSADDGDCVTI